MTNRYAQFLIPVTLGISALTSVAQTTQEMVITGSFIKRTEAETASPVQTITRRDIEQLGSNTLRQILNTVTAFDTGTLADNGNRSSFASGATGAGMRGLGKQAALVLLNGRRVSNYALTDGAKETFVNLDTFPADAIERIEILKDGASALYGSEAMAGVINIITKQNFKGMTGSVAYQEAGNGLAAQKTSSVTFGKGDMRTDKYNFFGTLEGYKREGYFLSDSLPLYPDYYIKTLAPTLGAPSTVSSPGNIYKDPLKSTSRDPNPSCTVKNSAGLCVTNINSTLDQRSDPAQRMNFFGSGRMELSPTLELFGEATFSSTQTDYLNTGLGINNPATPHLWYDGGLKQIISLSKPLLPVTHPLNTYGRPIGIEYRFMDSQIDYKEPAEATQYKLLAGLRGEIGNSWSWEASIARYGAEATKASKLLHKDYGSFISSGAYVIGGPNTQTVLDQMIKVGSVNATTDTNYIDARVVGTPFKTASGPVKAAFGVERRDESMFIQSSENIMKAELVGRGAQEAIGDRTLSAAYAELEAPLTKQLFLNGALRLDSASGFESRVSPKIAMRFKALDNLMLRGTVGTGFRTPNVAETLARVGVTGFFNGTFDPKRCDTATSIRDALNTGNATDKLDAAAAYNSGCSASVPAMIGANPKLTPETSQNLTVGFVLEPTRNTSIAVDYFKINRKNEIDYRGIDYVLERETTYASQISRLPIDATDTSYANRANELKPGSNFAWTAGKLSSVVLAYENMGRTQTSGIDIDARARFKLDGGEDATLQFMATRQIKYLNWDLDAQAWEPNYVGAYGNPKWIYNVAASVRNPNWNYGARVSYVGSTSLNATPYGTDLANWGPNGTSCTKYATTNPTYSFLPCKIAGFATVQLSVAYTGIKNTRLSFTTFNVAKDASPEDIRRGTGPSFRSMRVAAEHRFF
jgi:iron complex outermembrane recepter protein